MDDDEITKNEASAEAPAQRRPPNAGIGRAKGVPNKITQSLRQAIMESFDRVGGVEYLVKVAEKDPKTYIPLLAKVLPHQIQAEVTASGQIVFKTMYESQPEALPSPVVDLTADIIEADLIEVRPSGSDDSP